MRHYGSGLLLKALFTINVKPVRTADGGSAKRIVEQCFKWTAHTTIGLRVELLIVY